MKKLDIKPLDIKPLDIKPLDIKPLDIKPLDEKIYKSASLTFYDKNLGYLICEEFRHKEKKILSHTIGGKVENYDRNIFSTAIREFIEETNLLTHPIINSSNKNKNDLIVILDDIVKNESYCLDICVNKVQNYYHMYFIVLLEKIEDTELKKSIIELPNYFNGNYISEINKIFWHDNNVKKTKTKTKTNISWLAKMFFLLTKNTY